jgi:hypothetical protein
MQQAFIFFIPGIQVLIQAAGQAHAVRGSSAFRRHVLSWLAPAATLPEMFIMPVTGTWRSDLQGHLQPGEQRAERQ